MSCEITAYIPCFNRTSSLEAVIASVRAQTVPVSQLFVVDDGSADDSAEKAQRMGVPVIRHARNLGRGAVRARAMQEAMHDLVLSCDATNLVPPGFIAMALPWFEAPHVAAVFGRVVETGQLGIVSRWRKRHLFKADLEQPLNRKASLATGGVMMRRAHVLTAGNFNPLLRHSEDAELGKRLLAAGYDVIFDPDLKVTAIGHNTLPQVLERYWRWYAGKAQRTTWKGYMKQIVYSIKVMARLDLHARDPLCALISLISPHYQFWRSFCGHRATGASE